jgi:hypothetical protein
MFDPQFASIKVLQGYSHGRRDDIESLGYIILSMIKPEGFKIPWSGVDPCEYDEILRLKCEFLGI